MAEIRDPHHAAAASAGDPGSPGAEHESGDAGEGAAEELTLEQLQAQRDDFQQKYEESQRQNDLLVRIASRSRAAADAPASPPTAPDPRADEIARDRANNQAKMRRLEGEIAILAEKGDPTSQMMLESKRERLEDLQVIGNALRSLQSEIQELRADASVEGDQKDKWKSWYKEHRSDYNTLEAARLAFDGHLAREESITPPKPPANGKGADTPAPRTPVRQRVAINIRPQNAAETRRTVQEVRGDDFDDQIAELQAAGDKDGARALQRRVNDGTLKITD